MINVEGYTNKNPHVIQITTSYFNGGETNVRIIEPKEHPDYQKIIVNASITGPSDLIKMLLVKDALTREFGAAPVYVLRIGYIPYGRQDRVCKRGEAFSLHVMIQLINSMNFDEVRTLDIHSDASNGINNLKVTDQGSMIGQAFKVHRDILAGEVIMVAPDKGARGKVKQLAKEMNVDFIQAYKTRDPETGKLTEFKHDQVADEHLGKRLLIVDDICDRGGTFIGLAEVLKESGFGQIALYVSHGIFSKGLGPLYEGGIDHIFCADTIKHGYGTAKRFTNLYWS